MIEYEYEKIECQNCGGGGILNVSGRYTNFDSLITFCENSNFVVLAPPHKDEIMCLICHGQGTKELPELTLEKEVVNDTN